jgi:galactose mutarotase-like enzyme
VIFTGRPEAVCVEPQTAPPDATALGAEQVAAPGAPVRLESVWRWTLH